MKNKAFTLAETLIVIGIIGVVAALTLPNLNHATGDKETVTRVMKTYSMLNEANDRAIATYGPISSWKSQPSCYQTTHHALDYCYLKRIAEFMKVTKSCNFYDENYDPDCLRETGTITEGYYRMKVADGLVIASDESDWDCSDTYGKYSDVCLHDIEIDINGSNKGKDEWGQDCFKFMVSDSVGVVPFYDWDSVESGISACLQHKSNCSWWVIEYGNLDYLKTDSTGKCNDNPSIVLDGVTNTSCH